MGNFTYMIVTQALLSLSQSITGSWATRSMCEVEYECERGVQIYTYGGDWGDQGFAGCINWCHSRLDCQFFSYCPNRSLYPCKLYSSCTKWKRSSKCSSGERQCPLNSIYRNQIESSYCNDGHTLDSIYAGMGEEECREECLNLNGCHWYTYLHLSRTCLLLDRCGWLETGHPGGITGIASR